MFYLSGEKKVVECFIFAEIHLHTGDQHSNRTVQLREILHEELRVSDKYESRVRNILRNYVKNIEVAFAYCEQIPDPKNSYKMAQKCLRNNQLYQSQLISM